MEGKKMKKNTESTVSPRRVLPGRFMGSITLGEYKSVREILEAIKLKWDREDEIYVGEPEFLDKIKMSREKKEIRIWEASVKELFTDELPITRRFTVIGKDYPRREYDKNEELFVNLSQILRKGLSYGLGYCPFEAFMLFFASDSSIKHRSTFFCATTPFVISFKDPSIFCYKTGTGESNNPRRFVLVREKGGSYQEDDSIFYFSGPEPEDHFGLD